jgi:hypothetical protein
MQIPERQRLLMNHVEVSARADETAAGHEELSLPYVAETCCPNIGGRVSPFGQS